MKANKVFPLLLLLLLFLLPSVPLFAAKKGKLPTRLPDIPARATVFIENTSAKWSREAGRFMDVLKDVVAHTDNKHSWVRPGLRVVDQKEGADYVLSYTAIAHEMPNGCNLLSCNYTYTQGNFRVTLLLTNANGTQLWSQEYFCQEPLGGISAEECADHVANEIKSAEVNDDGQRAGGKGWKDYPVQSFASSPKPKAAQANDDAERP
jgi:hypothetical protein